MKPVGAVGEPEWKMRFRLPVIRGVQVAAGVPERGLVAQGTADPARVLVTGWSCGGYLTLQALGTRPDLWAAGMAGIAVADWEIAHDDTTDKPRGWRAARFGGTPEEPPERYAGSEGNAGAHRG